MNYNTQMIINGIANKIYEIFGENYNIETSGVMQDFNKPAFFIKEINDREIPYLSKRYRVNKSFCIYGFSENDTDEELYEMGEKLYNLEYINLENGNLLKGLNMNFKIEDRVLVFLIDFNSFIHKQDTIEEKEKMKNININKEVM